MGKVEEKHWRAVVWKSVGWGKGDFLGSALSAAELHAVGSYRWQGIGGVFLLRGDKFRKKVLEQVAGGLYLSCVEVNGSPKPHRPWTKCSARRGRRVGRQCVVFGLWFPGVLPLAENPAIELHQGSIWLAFWPTFFFPVGCEGVIVGMQSWGWAVL